MKFNFTTNGDGKKNLYFNCYSCIDTEAVVSVDKKNYVLKGSPKIVMRKGESNFGDQLLFQFLIKEVREVYHSNSRYGTLEYYLPLDQGIEFLEETLKFLKEKQ